MYKPEYQYQEYDNENKFDNTQHSNLQNINTMFYNQQITRTSNLPINDHIQKLEVMLSELVDDLDNSKKTMQLMRGDLLNLGYIESQNNQGMTQLIQDEAIRVQKGFKKQQEQQKIEHEQFIKQIKQLRENRKDLTNKIRLVDHRVNETESNVGFKQAFATIQDNDDEIQQQLDQYEQYQQQYQQEE